MAAAALFYDQDAGGKAINAHVGIIGLGDRPRRLPEVEAVINGRVVDEALMERAAEVTSATVEAQEDIHASAAYRRSLAGTMVERALAKRRRTITKRQEIMPTNFEVNGKPVSVNVEARTTLADCLRHHLRLTGTHVGCEHGVCGACTVIVDGDAVRSCLMLTAQAEGSKVVTVEGLSNDEALTPLQASFRKHHALQCGFCTPGMITTAHALLERGARLRRRPRARGALRQSLPLHRLHLDRRGGARRARGLQEAGAMKNAFIGSAIERREDLRFLRGRGEYVDDLAPDGLLYAVILRSSVAHGRIVSIDTTAALKIPGVHAVITAKDMPAAPPIVPMRLQPLPEFKPFEQPVIAHDKVRYVGEPMAVVIADSVAIGEDALEAIEVEIESLPAVADWHVAHSGQEPAVRRARAPTAR